MRFFKKILVLVLVMLTSGCITEFIPDIGKDPEFFVVEGMITDQPGRYTIRVSQSIPLGTEAENKPVRKCTVWIMDDQNHRYNLTESAGGTYLTDGIFMGEPGRKYVLNISIPARLGWSTTMLRSEPMEMYPVPAVDSLYYEKVELRKEDGYAHPGECCQVFLNTSDPGNVCRFYRWDYSETWKIIAPRYDGTINRVCWVTGKSTDIILKNTLGLEQNRLDHLPVRYISNESDILRVRYRIEVNQYSLNEGEYNYWSDLEKISENTGSLHDIIPASIQGNMICINDPDIQVLGYFSVSAIKSKVLYVEDSFDGLVSPYSDCLSFRWFLEEGEPVPCDIGMTCWVLFDALSTDGYMDLTFKKECVDCTARGGSTVKPDFWEEGRQR